MIVTGISGAGRSQAIKCLEDFGFFCVDNLPAPFLPRFADLIVKSGKSMSKVALGIDVREGRFFKNMTRDLQEFRSRKINPWILFFDADDATLLRRFSETRRKHPLANSVQEGIREERRRLRDIRTQADRIIDTSSMTLNELKERVAAALPLTLKQTIHITIKSFGFKYGLPVDADLVWDVRFLPNPHYIPALRPKTGMSREVRNFVLRRKECRSFLPKFFGLVTESLPHFIKEGKSHLTIAIGCTGGRHRSVAISEALAKHLKTRKYVVSVQHRDMD